MDPTVKDAITLAVAVLAVLLSLYNLKKGLAADRQSRRVEQRAIAAEERALNSDREKLELAFLSEQQIAMLKIDQAMDYLATTSQKWERLLFDARLVDAEGAMDTASKTIDGLERQRGELADLREAIDPQDPPVHRDIAVLRRFITDLNPHLPAEADKDQDGFIHEQARRQIRMFQGCIRMNADPAAAMSGTLRPIDPSRPIDKDEIDRFIKKFRDNSCS